MGAVCGAVSDWSGPRKMSLARSVHYTDMACKLITDARRICVKPKSGNEVMQLLNAAKVYEKLAEEEAKA